MEPLIVQVALNGDTRKSTNPNVPVSPREIIEDAVRCADAGAQIVHFHIGDYQMTGEEAAGRYMEAWSGIASARSDLLVAPTIPQGGDMAERWSHARILVDAGLLRLHPLDPGSMNLPGAATRPDGTPGEESFVYANSYQDIEFSLARAEEMKIGLLMSIFDPNFLRAAIAYSKAGRIRHGALLFLYFGGDFGMNASVPNAFNFGFRPTRKALDAYLEMLEGSKLAWGVNVFGGDAVASGMAAMAIEAGGHVRVGLEDFGGERRPTNVELVKEVVALARRMGRPLADQRTAARLIGLDDRQPGMAAAGPGMS